MQVKKQQFELNIEQQTGSKLGKENIKAVYYHPDYLIYMQSISGKRTGWMKHKLESRLLREILVTIDDTILMAESEEEPLDESESRQWKNWLKTQLSKN